MSVLLHPLSFFESLPQGQSESATALPPATPAPATLSEAGEGDFQRDAIGYGITLDHNRQEIVINGRRSPAGQPYRLFNALWHAPGGLITGESLARSVYGENDVEWPTDWEGQLQQLKSRVKAFLNEHGGNAIGDALLPRKSRGSDLHSINRNLQT
jgi:hypothetical protein